MRVRSATAIFSKKKAEGLGLLANCARQSVAALTVHRTVIHYRSPSSPPTHAQKNTECPNGHSVFFGRGGRTRTHDPWFWRPVLYQLSYTPMHPYIILDFIRFVKWFFKKTKFCFLLIRFIGEKMCKFASNDNYTFQKY